ncbi:MAG: flagellar basal-body MS-ring/collar protein FliF [Actinobacteria bacterium]|nr:flagellar basal-body MS-ring/collar protein FliF [Actinomycetota bacterium]
MPTPDQSNALGRAKELAGKLTPIQKITLGAVLLTVIAGGLVLSRSSDAVPMTALYTDLDAADAASVVDSLAGRGVQYDLADGGKTVMVPKTEVYDLRVALAGEGLPSSNDGYALLDNQGITTSEFRQRVDYQRALEGELAKTLTALDGVQSASVRLALPDESLFVDEPASPSAAVLVVPQGVGGITSNEVEAIMHLVASSVKDMKPEDVSIVDSEGNVLSVGGGSTSGGMAAGGMNDRTKATAAYEADMQASILAMLSKALGSNKVGVTVTAELDLDQAQQTSEDYGTLNPDGEELPYVIANSASREEYGADAEGANGNGETGILGPDGALTADDITVDDGTGTPVAASGYVKEEADTQYAIDRVVEQRTIVPGKVTQVNVAIVVDEATVTPEQIDQIDALVKATIGYSEQRGDKVEVEALPFDTTASTEAEALAAAEEAAASKTQMMGMVRTIAVLLVIIIALILGYRSAKKARTVTVTPINIGEITTGPRPSLGPGSAIDPLSELDNESVPIAINRPPDRDAIVMNELTQMADRRPQEVANVLRAWLAENKAGARR